MSGVIAACSSHVIGKVFVALSSSSRPEFLPAGGSPPPPKTTPPGRKYPTPGGVVHRYAGGESTLKELLKL